MFRKAKRLEIIHLAGGSQTPLHRKHRVIKHIIFRKHGTCCLTYGSEMCGRPVYVWPSELFKAAIRQWWPNYRPLWTCQQTDKTCSSSGTSSANSDRLYGACTVDTIHTVSGTNGFCWLTDALLFQSSFYWRRITWHILSRILQFKNVQLEM